MYWFLIVVALQGSSTHYEDRIVGPFSNATECQRTVEQVRKGYDFTPGRSNMPNRIATDCWEGKIDTVVIGRR